MQTSIFYINKAPAARICQRESHYAPPPSAKHIGSEGLAMISLSIECAEDSANQTPSDRDYFGPWLIVLVSHNF